MAKIGLNQTTLTKLILSKSHIRDSLHIYTLGIDFLLSLDGRNIEKIEKFLCLPFSFASASLKKSSLKSRSHIRLLPSSPGWTSPWWRTRPAIRAVPLGSIVDVETGIAVTTPVISLIIKLGNYWTIIVLNWITQDMVNLLKLLKCRLGMPSLTWNDKWTNKILKYRQPSLLVKMTILWSKVDVLSANSRFAVQIDGTYLPRITRKTCILNVLI